MGNGRNGFQLDRGTLHCAENHEALAEVLNRRSALISSAPASPKTSESPIFPAQILRPLAAASRISNSTAGRTQPRKRVHRPEIFSPALFLAATPSKNPAGKKTSVSYTMTYASRSEILVKMKRCMKLAPGLRRYVCGTGFPSK